MAVEDGLQTLVDYARSVTRVSEIISKRDDKKCLAFLIYIGIIIFTDEKHPAVAQNRYGQSRGSAPERHPQPSPRKGAGSVVSGREFFRSAGSGAGQVRDAAQSPKRGDADQWGGCWFRFFSSRVLQSTAGLYSRRPSGPDPQTARPERQTQAYPRGSRFRRADPRSEAAHPNSGTGSADSAGVLYSGAPSKPGAGAGGGQKKTATAVVAGVTQLPPAAVLTDQYEALRAYVTARIGSSGLRLGQGVIMSRGMAAWIRVAGELIPPVRSAPPISCGELSVPPLIQDDLIHLMGEAVMTLACAEHCE